MAPPLLTSGIDLLLERSILELLGNIVGRTNSGDDAVGVDDDRTLDHLFLLCVPVVDNFNLVHGRSAQHLLVVLGNHHELLRIAHNKSEGFLHCIAYKSMTVSLGENWGLGRLLTHFLQLRSPLV